MTKSRGVLGSVSVAMCALCFAGCPNSDNGESSQNDGAPAFEAGDPDACVRTPSKLAVGRNDKLDLLFMVDNSESMAGEQAALAQQLPALIDALTHGMRTPDDPNPFAPVTDLHVGIVSSDMGISGVEFENCHADGGDNGRLLHEPHGAGCDAQYPTFLSFTPGTGAASQFAQDVACISQLGTGGCDFEQQLESPFKALWPKVYRDAAGNVVNPNPYRFIAITEEGTWGHGDVPPSEGGNLGFLRNDVGRGSSVIAVVVVTDEDDCSVQTTKHLLPSSMLPEDSPYKLEDFNLRCFYHKEFLYDLQERYLKGFQALRPGNEERVVFAAITGVPADLVDQAALSQVDLTDDAQRDAFYNAILSDPRMQEEIDPSTMPGSGQGNLRPSCVRPVPGEDTPSTAFPPRRIVQLAQMFGKNGIVQSICQDDFGPPVAALTNVLSRMFGEECLPKALERASSGLVACDVVFELPAPGTAPTGTPTDCDELPYLAPAGGADETVNKSGSKNCKVQQLAASSKSVPAGEGWYYDDFSEDVTKFCEPDRPQRIAFTPSAKPPNGVTIKLRCQIPISMVATTAKGLTPNPPAIGAECTSELECARLRPDGKIDPALVCHHGFWACVQRCKSEADCPDGWRCDSSSEALAATGGHAYCYNPKCAAVQ